MGLLGTVVPRPLTPCDTEGMALRLHLPEMLYAEEVTLQVIPVLSWKPKSKSGDAAESPALPVIPENNSCRILNCIPISKLISW